ncbi:hypothetical protein EYF80_055936 [Liparis tanakae]|uniref:Uncharacterized protein n=1 Tax=Liparis tanakae TaxID=230148 RepID=A0A4Z2EZE3_9TELE|nr:hypothetical protein EYF80_055936 [Liparis tanakae]
MLRTRAQTRCLHLTGDRSAGVCGSEIHPMLQAWHRVMNRCKSSAGCVEPVLDICCRVAPLGAAWTSV